jgi:phospholipase/carboxylesterase
MRATIILFVFLQCGFVSSGVYAQSLYVTQSGLKYLVREAASREAKPPLFVLLHGYGSNERDLFSLAAQLPANAVVVALRAPHALDEHSYAWFHITHASGNRSYNREEAEESRKQIMEAIDELKKNYGAGNVFLLGFSQGAIMSLGTGLTAPEKVTGIIALSGGILDIVKPAPAARLGKLHVFIGHGTNDQVLTIDHSESAYKTCTKLGVKVTFKKYPMAHQITEDELKDVTKWISEVNKK